MSTGPLGEHERPPERAGAGTVRRRHLLERQAVIFGGLITILLALGLVSVAVWFGAVPAPFDVAFVTPEDSVPAQPCPPEDARPIPYGEITASVLNGTTRSGLAAATASELETRGISIDEQANAPAKYSGATLITTGDAGLVAAYTVAAIFPGAVIELDTREDATIDIILGSEFESVQPAGGLLDPDQPFAQPAGCIS